MGEGDEQHRQRGGGCGIRWGLDTCGATLLATFIRLLATLSATAAVHFSAQPGSRQNVGLVR